jgi:hypothetical protein
MAGYSGKPVFAKLGIAEGARVAALDAPGDYAGLVGGLPETAAVASRVTARTTLVHLFATRRAELARRLGDLRGRLAPEIPIWVSWPKRAAKVATDLTEDGVRELALPLGFVDVKVCAVDATWSGLKLVVRRELR